MDCETSSPRNPLFNASSLSAKGEMSPHTSHNFLPVLKAIYMLRLMYFRAPESLNDTTINNGKTKEQCGRNICYAKWPCSSWDSSPSHSIALTGCGLYTLRLLRSHWPSRIPGTPSLHLECPEYLGYPNWAAGQQSSARNLKSMSQGLGCQCTGHASAHHSQASEFTLNWMD